MKVLKKVLCPKCGSRDSRFRVKSNEFVCIRCGNIWESQEFQDRVMTQI